MPTSSSDFEIEVELFIQALYLKYHYDFRHYSRSSVRRRLTQALTFFRCSSISHLQHLILRQPEKLPALLNFLTVPTTEMFRDPSYYLALRQKVIPFLQTYPSLRAWIAGCSTGEEVYSMAILFKEENLLHKTIFYATDINPQSIEKAKRGIYDTASIQKASANYQKSGGRSSLSDYYSAAYGAAQMKAELTEQAVFSDHSLATDSCFSEMHLVSCRNVLIYFDRTLQDRAIGLFHESLIRSGFLGLGSKESLHFSKYRDQFSDITKENKIFQKI